MTPKQQAPKMRSSPHSGGYVVPEQLAAALERATSRSQSQSSQTEAIDPSNGLTVVVRNTFLTVVDANLAKARTHVLQRSRSDSELDSSSSSCAEEFQSQASRFPSNHSQGLPSPLSRATSAETFNGSADLADQRDAHRVHSGAETSGSAPDSIATGASFYQNVAATEFLSRVLPSLGSSSHMSGDCKPCTFFQKNRCLKGRACSHCHFDHELVTRPGKKNRVRAKRKQEREDAQGALPGNEDDEDGGASN